MWFLYLIVIIIANVVTASFTPISWGGLLVPWGTVFIGVTFILRDLCQEKYGRFKIYVLISVAMILSSIVSFLLGDSLNVVLASCLSFALSETTDTEIYSRLKLPFHLRVLYSGIVGGLLDSVVFVIVGLSPIGANFLTWSAVPNAIVGQIIVKSIMQIIGCLILKSIIKRKGSIGYEV